MEITLLFPPQSTPTMPYLSVPSLTAYVRSKGYNVIQRDLNVETYDILLSKNYLKKIYEKICCILDNLELKNRSAYHQDHYKRLRAARAEAPHLMETIEEAKQVYRSKDFYDFLKYSNAKQEIYHALELISTAYYPTELKFSSFKMGNIHQSSKNIIEAVQDRKRNPFIEIYEENFLPQIYNENPDLIGISIINSSQIIPALTLAYLIKSLTYEGHITVGGSIFSRLAGTLLQKKKLFLMFFDSVIIYEGERPLLELIKSISEGKNLRKVPNLIYYNGSEVQMTESCVPEPMNSLPTPCFDGLPFNLYFSPQPILPLLSSRGCYWQKCAFCDHGYIYSDRYEVRDSAKVVDDLKKLHEKYDTSCFAFADEGISPHVFETLSKEIKKRKLDLHFLANARFEPQFTKKLLRKIAEAGFRCLLFGLESGCDRVLSCMKKGINTKTALNVCRNSAQAGIWNHLFLFYGFPTETEEEAQETTEFIFSNKEVINSVGSAVFVLRRNSPVKENPNAYGVSKICEDPNRDLQLRYDYSVQTGMTQEQAEKIRDDFLKQLPEEYSDYRVWGILCREHLLLYLVHCGTNDLSLIEESMVKEVVKRKEKDVVEVVFRGFD